MANIACELKYTREIKIILANEMNAPSEEFVKFFAKRVNDAPFTQSVREKFTVITKNALGQFINDKINERLKFAMTEESVAPTSNTSEENISSDTSNNNPEETVTTEEETEGYYIIKSILRENVDLTRVVIRDKKSYCGVLLDNNNRKPICRMYFNTKQKYMGLFDEDKNEEKIPIQSLNDIYNYAEKLKSTASSYDRAEKSKGTVSEYGKQKPESAT